MGHNSRYVSSYLLIPPFLHFLSSSVRYPSSVSSWCPLRWLLWRSCRTHRCYVCYYLCWTQRFHLVHDLRANCIPEKGGTYFSYRRAEGDAEVHRYYSNHCGSCTTLRDIGNRICGIIWDRKCDIDSFPVNLHHVCCEPSPLRYFSWCSNKTDSAYLLS